MIKTRNFTTTFPIKMLSDLDTISKELKVQKNDILLISFTKWYKEEIQKKIAESYKNASKDPELNEIAEEGMEDYNKQLLEWEK